MKSTRCVYAETHIYIWTTKMSDIDLGPRLVHKVASEGENLHRV